MCPDATLDGRFAASPTVTVPLEIRFLRWSYAAGCQRFCLGTRAVADTVPHVITEQQKDFFRGGKHSAWPHGAEKGPG